MIDKSELKLISKTEHGAECSPASCSTLLQKKVLISIFNGIMISRRSFILSHLYVLVYKLLLNKRRQSGRMEGKNDKFIRASQLCRRKPVKHLSDDSDSKRKGNRKRYMERLQS